jgi:rod shape-determining protein MreC
MFTRGPSLGTRLMLLVIVSVLLMVLDHREQHLESVRNGLSVAVYPIRLAVDLPSRALRWAAESLSSRSRLLDENRRLRDERLQFLARLQLLEALQAEKTRLRALLDSAGIVGQVTRVEPFSSEAILISDPGHATPVEVNRNGLRTVALGTGDSSRVDLPFLPNNADIHVGDLLVSSGLGGTFPPGYPVAQVISVDRLPGEPFAVIAAEPTGALNREREVLLVWNRPAQPPPDADRREGSQAAGARASGDSGKESAGEDSR